MGRKKKDKGNLQTPRTRKQQMDVRHEFSATEITALGDELAKQTEHAVSLTDEAKRVSANYKTQIREANGMCTILAGKITRGYEMRTVDVTVSFHTPANGKKQVVIDATGEVHGTYDMTADEMQELLPLSEADDKTSTTIDDVLGDKPTDRKDGE